MDSFKKKILKLIFREEKFKNIKFAYLGENSSVIGPYIIKNPRYIKIGSNFSSLYNLRLEAWDSYENQKFTPKLVIGNNVSFNSDVHIGCIDKVIIGDNVLMASRIFIADCSHGQIDQETLHIPPIKRPLFSKGPVIIGNNVWIGEGVSILPDVTIGENSIIGANAVVTKNIPANSVAGGIPCKIIKTL